ncbi:MAG TPA: 2-C-methyl-D-erythritol 4-phosphate cytidylyltransferase, partial [Mycoplana sp.]|nr:2-C-methyl-D-erythritol 4-phosphate cytidylyltransferase [Mycoplana sp.]
MGENSRLSCGVIVVAAGRGERAGSHPDGPKQYRNIGGRPVITRTLDAFINWGPARDVIAVIHPVDNELFANALAQVSDGRARIRTVIGGRTRQQSVLAG